MMNPSFALSRDPLVPSLTNTSFALSRDPSAPSLPFQIRQTIAPAVSPNDWGLPTLTRVLQNKGQRPFYVAPYKAVSDLGESLSVEAVRLTCGTGLFSSWLFPEQKGDVAKFNVTDQEFIKKFRKLTWRQTDPLMHVELSLISSDGFKRALVLPFRYLKDQGRNSKRTPPSSGSPSEALGVFCTSHPMDEDKFVPEIPIANFSQDTPDSAELSDCRPYHDPSLSDLFGSEYSSSSLEQSADWNETPPSPCLPLSVTVPSLDVGEAKTATVAPLPLPTHHFSLPLPVPAEAPRSSAPSQSPSVALSEVRVSFFHRLLSSLRESGVSTETCDYLSGRGSLHALIIVDSGSLIEKTKQPNDWKTVYHLLLRLRIAVCDQSIRLGESAFLPTWVLPQLSYLVSEPAPSADGPTAFRQFEQTRMIIEEYTFVIDLGDGFRVTPRNPTLLSVPQCPFQANCSHSPIVAASSAIDIENDSCELSLSSNSSSESNLSDAARPAFDLEHVFQEPQFKISAVNGSRFNDGRPLLIARSDRRPRFFFESGTPPGPLRARLEGHETAFIVDPEPMRKSQLIFTIDASIEAEVRRALRGDRGKQTLHRKWPCVKARIEALSGSGAWELLDWVWLRCRGSSASPGVGAFLNLPNTRKRPRKSVVAFPRTHPICLSPQVPEICTALLQEIPAPASSVMSAAVEGPFCGSTLPLDGPFCSDFETPAGQYLDSLRNTK